MTQNSTRGGSCEEHKWFVILLNIKGTNQLCYRVCRCGVIQAHNSSEETWFRSRQYNKGGRPGLCGKGYKGKIWDAPMTDHEHDWKTIITQRRRVVTYIGDIKQCATCDALVFELLLSDGAVWEYSPMSIKDLLRWLKSK